MMKAHFLALALAIAPAVPAFCGNVTADNPIAIAELMKTFGYRAELTADDQGDPKIKSSAGGANFSVYFYGCTKNKDCTSIQFSAGFDLSDGTTMDVVNDWNANKRYGKVYLDSEKDPYIELDVNLDLGGVTEENLRDTLEIWDRLVSDFKTHIDW
ncbi:MAG: YbjN domain-containing protein [Paracoccaceae bacterium]